MIFNNGSCGRDGRDGRIGEALCLVMALALSGCTRFENVMASIPVFSFLRDAPSLDPYEAPRPAPPNSVPFQSPAGDVPRGIPNTEVGLVAFGTTITNPLSATDTTALRNGQVMFERHCMVCHGTAGAGDGPILNKPGEMGKFPFAPNLLLPVTVARTDGFLYGIIAAGRGLMPAYGARMTHLERWATVLYLRQLQRQAAPAANAVREPDNPDPPAPDTPDTPDTPATPATPGVAAVVGR